MHAGEAHQALLRFADGLDGLSAEFEQQVFDTNDRPMQSSSGRLALARPNLFRFDYLVPYEQSVIADGLKVYSYDPDLEQVTVRPQGPEMQNNPITILLDPQRLEREFKLSERSADGQAGLILAPRLKRGEQAEFERIELWFEDGSLRRLALADRLGQRSELRFTRIDRDPELDLAQFSFVPPPGVDVVGDLEPAAEVYALPEQ